MSKTKIITIEGIDGSGKTVQFELLTKGLQDMGFTVQKRAYPVYDAFSANRSEGFFPVRRA